MSETTRAVLKSWLLIAVADLGGSAPRADVHGRVEDKFGHQFTTEDRLPRVGRRGEEAWRNNLDSLYHLLKKEGLMMPSSRGDEWQISPQGSMFSASQFPP